MALLFVSGLLVLLMAVAAPFMLVARISRLVWNQRWRMAATPDEIEAVGGERAAALANVRRLYLAGSLCFVMVALFAHFMHVSQNDERDVSFASHLRRDALRRLPLGATSAEVKSFIARRHWDWYQRRDQKRAICRFDADGTESPLIGKRSVYLIFHFRAERLVGISWKADDRIHF